MSAHISCQDIAFLMPDHLFFVRFSADLAAGIDGHIEHCPGCSALKAKLLADGPAVAAARRFHHKEDVPSTCNSTKQLITDGLNTGFTSPMVANLRMHLNGCPTCRERLIGLRMFLILSELPSVSLKSTRTDI